jgi:hypothetical protein
MVHALSRGNLVQSSAGASAYIISLQIGHGNQKVLKTYRPLLFWRALTKLGISELKILTFRKAVCLGRVGDQLLVSSWDARTKHGNGDGSRL